MAPLPDVASVLRVAMGFTLISGGPALSRFYLHYSGSAPSAGQLGTFNASIATAYGTDLKPLASADVELTSIETTDLSSSTGAQAVTPEAITGTRAGTNVTAEQCVVTSYEITRRYRGGHPRGYWPFGVVGDQASVKTWSAGLVTAVNSGMAAFMTAVEAAGWSGAGTIQQCNISYFKGFTVVTSPTTGRARNVPTLRAIPVVDNVTSIVARSSIGVQRRRLEFVD